MLGRPKFLRSESEQICLEFARQIRDVAIVNEVRVTEDDDRITAWVITDGPAFDFESNKPIYQAVIHVIASHEESAFDFRVININELEEGVAIQTIIPPDAKLVWKKHPHA